MLARLCVFILVASPVALALPDQIHLALTASPDSMAVQFSTQASSSEETVRFGDDCDNLVNTLESSAMTHAPFTDSGDEKYTQYHHVGVMTGLETGSRYFYQVGSDSGGWSDVYDFTAAPARDAFPHRFGVWGDMGASNAQIIDFVKQEVDADNFDMILHVGDLAYDFQNDNGHNGDVFMNNIQPMAARVPYMTDVGNHEQAQQFAHYTERFRLLPGQNSSVSTDNGEAPNNWYYSHDFGNVHFISISTEVLFVPKRHEHIRKQHEFVENDLKNVDREKTPWIVVHGHRPMYCSCDADCDSSAHRVRTGGYELERPWLSLEDLFFKYGVDLYLAGHEHNYERMFDVYDGKTTQTTVNPPATVHIVTGDAGGPEQHEVFARDQPDRTAFRTDAYGYSRMTVHNDTHLYWEQVETDTDANVFNKVIDSVWIVQESHGPFKQ